MRPPSAHWTSDIRFIDHSISGTGLRGRGPRELPRAILASAVTLSQDTNAYLSVLHAAIGRYGSPRTIVTDGGGLPDRARDVYAALGIEKLEIERGQAWQSLIETNFGLQRRLADWHFAKAETWEDLVAEHDLWLERTTRRGTRPTRRGRAAGGARPRCWAP